MKAVMRFVIPFLLAAALLAGTPAATTSSTTEQVLHGKIRQERGKPPMIVTAEKKAYTVTGDDFTKAQMGDSRLNGREIEVGGHFTSATNFEAARLYTLKNGKRYEITYWCDVCSIRTHMPGRCMCCQGPTELQELPVP
jgi:hypothetical protein